MINSAYTPPLDLIRRPRRNRQNAAIRALVRETRVHVDDLIQPLFLKDGHGGPEDISSLPGIQRLNVRNTIAEVKRLAELGLRAVALFPQIDPSLKDARGKLAVSSKNWFFHAIKQLKAEIPDMLLAVDVALDPYTDMATTASSIPSPATSPTTRPCTSSPSTPRCSPKPGPTSSRPPT